MTGRRAADSVRAGLRAVHPPDAGGAEERSWAVVRAAYAEREPTPQAVGVARRFAVVAAAALVATGIALTPAGAEVREWIADAISPGEEAARSTVGSLPASGTLLVEAGNGVWVQRDDGSRRLLGDYDRATWSPNGLYVGASRGRELFALTAGGEVRWAITSPAPISALDWSTDEGYRIAYVAGESLRVVAGDGTGDVRVRERVGSDAIAWRPEGEEGVARHELAYVDGRNRVTLLDTDSGSVAWRSGRYATPPSSLDWSADGERLLVAGDGFGTVLDGSGSLRLKGIAAEAGPRLTPDGSRIAIVRRSAGGRSELALGSTSGRQGERVLYRAPAGTGSLGAPVVSPDGDWILVPWPAADQWLFVNARTKRVMAVAGVAAQFDPDRRGAAEAPRVAGWCC